jgi:amino acid transporter
LLTDYVLTVSVSVSAGVQAIYSGHSGSSPWAVPLIALSILLVMVVNLRGLKESGTLFASPTYIFIGIDAAADRGWRPGVAGLGNLHQVTDVGGRPASAGENMGVFLLCKAFADGCSAMTGTEAVANGVPAFKPPEWKNAQQTMIIMATLLGIMFLGTSFLASISVPPCHGRDPRATARRSSRRSAEPCSAAEAFALLHPPVRTMGILILAANTSFADFPRLSSILARDGFFPRQFSLAR